MAPQRQNRVFFYGLYMDPEVRAPLSGERRPGGVVTLDDYYCRIGVRSTLVPKPGSRVFGVVAELSDAECGRLYPAPSYSSYLPTKVTCVEPITTRRVAAISYIAPADCIGAFDATYAARLIALCRQLGFPGDYIEWLENERPASV
jgi:hypothetical protein